jgi:ABC-2 type transport system permease protein
MSAAVTYTRFEVLRAFRNTRFFIFSLGFPVVMYFLLAAPNKDDHHFGSSGSVHTNLFAPQYYMIGLLAFGTMVAALAGGGRISQERSVGWNRQLRLTPLTSVAYFRAKLITSYLLVLCGIALLYISGTLLGVRLAATTWLAMTGLVLIALIPFVALGIAIGHLLTPDSVGPALGGGVGLLAFLGGTWFPIIGSGLFVRLCQLLPSYWLVQAGSIGNGAHNPWGAKGWLVIAAWSVLCTGFATWAYRRDTKRV